MARGELASRITKRPSLASRITLKRSASLAHRVTKRVVPSGRRSVHIPRRTRFANPPAARRIPVPKPRTTRPLTERKFDSDKHGLSAIEDQNGFRRLQTDCLSLIVAVDGSCIHNGYPDARAGYGVFFSSTNASHHNSHGHVPEGSPQTSQFAELYAVMKALDIVHEIMMSGQNIRHVVFKTDSAYIEEGLCRYVFTWMRNGFKTVFGDPVVNGRAFRYLHEKIGLLEMEYGVQVSFCRVPKDLNAQADALARMGSLKL